MDSRREVWDGGQRSFLQGVCDQGANGRLAIQPPSGRNGLTNWAGSGGAGPPVRGQCWLPWGWESVRLKVLGWPPPCLAPDMMPVVTQWHLQGGECPAPWQLRIRATLLGAFCTLGLGCGLGGSAHTAHTGLWGWTHDPSRREALGRVGRRVGCR